MSNNPTAGRFISEDIIKGYMAIPATLNPYVYCWNRPFNFIDLDGKYPTIPFQIWMQRRFFEVVETLENVETLPRVEGFYGTYVDPFYFTFSGPRANVNMTDGMELLLIDVDTGLVRFGKETDFFSWLSNDTYARLLSGDAALGFRARPGADDNFIGGNIGAYALRGNTEFAIQIPFTDFNILLGLEGDVGSIGARFYYRDGRIRKGASFGVGGGWSIGFNRRENCDE